MKVLTAMTPVITKVYSKFLINLLVLVLLCAGWILAVPAWAQTLTVTEHQITLGSGDETTPTVGADSQSDLVVFTSRDTPGADGMILYRRIGSDGASDGQVIPVSDGVTNDVLNDTHGRMIVYTAFDPGQANSGSIMLYDIGAGWTIDLMPESAVANVDFGDRWIVWDQQGSNGREIWARAITGSANDLIAGVDGIIRSDPATSGDIVVW